jgi:ABC-type transport system involved in cytochrome bd biosynthesis fused ATPase/permease subunit
MISVTGGWTDNIVAAATVESIQLAEEAIILPILSPGLTIFGFLVVLVNVLKLLFALLRTSVVPKLRKLPASKQEVMYESVSSQNNFYATTTQQETLLQGEEEEAASCKHNKKRSSAAAVRDCVTELHLPKEVP